MTNDTDPIAPSLTLKIGLSTLDGGNRDWLAKTYAVSLDDVDRSWLQCREWLSARFAKLEQRDYTLLDETAVRERLEAALRLLIDWRARALQTERVENLTTEGRLPDEDPEDTSHERDVQPSLSE